MRLPSRLSTVLLTAVAGASSATVLTALPAAAQQPEHVSVVNTAHRGAMGHTPENTLAAFTLGVDQGSDLIESDVPATSSLPSEPSDWSCRASTGTRWRATTRSSHRFRSDCSAALRRRCSPRSRPGPTRSTSSPLTSC